jgi:hypothetical protein
MVAMAGQTRGAIGPACPVGRLSLIFLEHPDPSGVLLHQSKKQKAKSKKQ